MRKTNANTGLAKVAVQYSAYTFVMNQSLVLSINVYAENLHLRQAADRYHQCLKDRRQSNTMTKNGFDIHTISPRRTDLQTDHILQFIF